MYSRLLFLTIAALVSLPAPATLQEKPDTKTRATKPDDKKDTKELPLEGARTVAFTTEEGSWMSLDVSPDGKTIVFDLLGDLYVVPFSGGEAKRVTDGMAFDSQPRYAPDGQKIVFISDRSGDDNLWLAGPDGAEPTPLTKGKNNVFRSPEFTPDGKYVVVSKATPGTPPTTHLWMYHVDGGSGVKLTGNSEDHKNLFALGPAFGKDPRYVWYSERTSAGSVYNQMNFRWQLGRYDRWTGEHYRQSDERGAGMRPVLSPDGKWLVYATRWDAQTGLRLRNLESGDDSWLLYPVTRDDQESLSTRDLMPGSSFTPDSTALVTSFDGKLWSISIPDGAVAPIPFTAAVDQKIGPKLAFDYTVDQGPVRAQQIRYARLSPDGKRLAFTALSHVYVMDFPKGTPRRAGNLEAGEHHPSWSPDGRYVAYVTWSEQEGGHVYRVPADGGQPERLTRVASFYSDPTYSPDGQRLVVVRGPRMERQEDFSPAGRGGQALELVWLPAAGGDVTLISPYRNAGRPHFSSDGSRIYAWQGKSGLVSFRWDGTDRRTHIKITGYKGPLASEADPADEVVIAPDGERAIVQSATKIYMVTIPMVGGEDAPTISISSPDSAAVPVKKLTTVGGEFIDWAEKGTAVTWAMGRTFFRYDIEAARAAEDKRKAEEKARGEKEGDEPGDSAEEKDNEEEKPKKPAYEAVETEVVVEAPRARPSGVVALRGARAITMRGAEVIENADVVIRDNRIERIGRRGSANIPSGARVIDVSGKTIMPGIVDVHAHIWPAWDIHRTQVWEYLANLAYGVTTTRDPQTATTDILTYRDLVESGRMLGPRVYGTGPGVFWFDNVQSLDEARDVMSRYSKYWNTKTIKQYMAGNRQQRQWIVMAANEHEIMPTLEGGLDLKLNLTQMIDGYAGLEHTLPIMPLYKDVVQLTAQSGITYTPTLLVQYGGPWAENYFYESTDLHTDAKMRRFTPHADLDDTVLRRPWFHPQEYSFPMAARVLNDVVKAGGRVGLGGHGQRQGIQCHWEMWAVASGGMSNHDVLRVATIFGAEAIGFAKELGSLETGKLADLLVLDRNPLENIRNTTAIRYVMKNGELYEAETLDQIWPAQKKLPRQYWWDLEPTPRKGAPARPMTTFTGFSQAVQTGGSPNRFNQ
jgi:Tol biopolymer transport system component